VKLYMHPVSTTSRPIRLLIAEKRLPVEEQMVDLMTGEHHMDHYVAINPNRLVPVLQDGDFRLTESSAILKYLADKHDLPEYPKDLRARAKVNELMDWVNTNLNRDWAYNFVYPQIFPHHRRRSDEAHAGTIAWGKERSLFWLQVLDGHWLGHGGPYLGGERITIADYYGICFVTIGEVIGCDFSRWPNISRWVASMKGLGSWASVNEMLYGFAASVKDQPFERI
jgi:glutathione S-transferase